MSVMVTLTLQGDPKQLEEHAQSNADAMQEILKSAESHGLIAHRFYGSEGGEIMVVDEWPDQQSFESFFQENNESIASMMQAAGVTSEPQPKFWRKLETGDDYGWGA